MIRSLRRLLLVVPVLAIGAGAVGVARPPAAHAVAPPVAVTTPTKTYRVTLVARECATYTDITANLARNNIQESLRDLGADTAYATGQPITPSVEDANQPTCAPINGWTFTFGSGYQSLAVNKLSIVTGANGQGLSTATVPELDPNGLPTGRSVAGAVTVTLTAAQAQLAQRSSSLWLQGGTTTDPLNAAQFPGTYGFGALRCAIDNLNGDNVEWIAYTGTASHVFCYAYYVKPPPQSATVIVRKALSAPQPLNLSFNFQGDISFNNTPYQGAFALTVPRNTTTPVSTTFYRAEVLPGGAPWTFQECPAGGSPCGTSPDTGFVIQSITCASSLGTSAFTIGPNPTTGPQVSITTLTAGDVVTCTYTDAPPATGPLSLVKLTEGGFGGPFDFTIQPPTGPPVTVTGITTTQQENPALVASTPSAPTGTFTVTETSLPPSTGAGSWAMTAAYCNGVAQTITANSFSVAVTAGVGGLCIVENTFTPTASITIHKVTVGGTTTVDFIVVPDSPPPGVTDPTIVQTATTTSPGVPALATGGSLTGLPLGTYRIFENSNPFAPNGLWTFTSVDCGTPVGGFPGTEIVLDAAHPNASCTFTNTLVPYGSLTVVKQVDGDLTGRSGDVTIDISCTDGQTATLTGTAGQPGPFSLTLPEGIWKPTTCTVTEAATGVASGATVTTNWVVATDGTNGATGGTTTVDPVTVKLSQVVGVTITDTYATTPVLPPTGSTTDGIGLTGVWLVAGGMMLVIAARPRRDEPLG